MPDFSFKHARADEVPVFFVMYVCDNSTCVQVTVGIKKGFEGFQVTYNTLVTNHSQEHGHEPMVNQWRQTKW